MEGVFMSKKQQFEFQILTDFLNSKLKRKEAAQLLEVRERTISRKARKIVENTNYILAFELLCAAQAADLRGVDKLSPSGKIMYKATRETLEYMDYDKVYMDDLEELKSRIESGEFVEKVEKEVGELLIVHEK